MRRLTVTLTVVAMIAALLPFAALVAAAADAAPAPQIAAPAGKTAVRNGNDVLTVSGDAGELPPGPVSATLVGFGIDGVMFRDRVPGDPVTVSDDGQYQGSVTLGPCFGKPNQRCLEHPDPAGEITGVALKISGVPRSNIIRVDQTDPEIVRYELIQARTVRVVFSEPVRAPEGDNTFDWEVENLRPAGISDPRAEQCAYAEGDQMTTGCTRLLQLPALLNDQTEDATPFVEYLPDILAGQSQVYIDYAGNSLAISSAENSAALDRIRPAAPNIQTIDGRSASSGAVVSNEDSPVVRVNNLLENHRARLLLKRDGGGTRFVETTVAPGANTVDLTLPTMTGDGGYTVTAMAIDAAGNRSTDDTKSGPTERSNGAVPSATYTLDRRAPEVLAATLVNTTTVSVELTEAVVPDGDAGSWTVGGVALTASGSGTTRTLQAQSRLSNAALLRWEPTSSQAGSNGRYGDAAGNGMVALGGLELNNLPPLSAPRVTAPVTTTFTKADSVAIRGTADNRPNLVAELFDRGSETVTASTPVEDGTWSFSQELADDGRYSFEVRIRDTQTGVVSQRNGVSDVVRDTAAPQVEVSAPAEVMIGQQPPKYGVGDAVTVEWTATDDADDPKVPDHSRIARVIMVSGSGTRRDVSGALETQPGSKQSHTFRLTRNDLEDQGVMDLSFEVRVDDLARNLGSGESGEIQLLEDLIGFTPVLTSQTAGGSTIDVRFPAAMTGSTTTADWRVDGATPGAAQLSEDGRSVVLTVVGETDPNVRPKVKYAPMLLPMGERLQTANGTQVTPNARTTIDRIAPALSVTVPDRGPVTDADQVVFSGETDATASPNTIVAYRARVNGERFGSPLAKKRAPADGAWRMAVPLAPNRVNRIVVQAIDPSANRSQVLPSSPYRVIEDSVAPVVRVQAPRRGTTVRRTMAIRWSTVEANPSHVRLQYRLRDGEWKTITQRTADDGYFRWTAPKSLHADVFDLRVQAYDRAGKRRTTPVFGLLGDFARPVVRRSVTVGARSVRLFFSEPVYMPRFGFTVDGIGVRRVVHDGAVNTLILNRPISRTTPVVRYRGTTTRDRAGNQLAAFEQRAQRGFVFAVTNLDGDRLSSTRVRLTWHDDLNRPAHVARYVVYRDGRRIGSVAETGRAFTGTAARGENVYAVRVVDNEGRTSAYKRVTVR